MQISSLQERYTVRREYGEEGDPVRTLIAEADDGTPYYFVSIDAREAAGIYEMLERLRKKAHFTDLHAHFFSDGRLYAAFAMPAGIPLSEKLAREKLSAAERLRLLKNILERMILLDAPPELLCGALNGTHIYADAALRISFLYDGSDLLCAKPVPVKKIGAAFADICELVFEEELRLKSFEDLRVLCGRLRTADAESYMDLYRLYDAVYAAHCGMQDAAYQPETLLAKAQRFLQKLVQKKRLIICTLLLIGAALYLAYSVRERMLPDARAPHFSQIGIREFDETQDADAAADENGT